MSDYNDFTTSIAEWANRGDWSPVLLASFVRDAESKFNAELRIDRMIHTVDALIAGRCALLPDDWLESDFTRLANPNSPTGFSPIYYKPRAEFWLADDSDSQWTFTIEGRQIFVGGAPDDVNGRTVRIDYYQEVPVFADDQDSWVYTRFQSMYRYAALMNTSLHAVGEEQNSSLLKQLCEDMIQKLNANHYRARASGSRLMRSRVRSFG